MHTVRPAGSGSRAELEAELEMDAFEAAADAALVAEAKAAAEARRLDNPALDQRHTENTAQSAADSLPEDTSLLSRAAEPQTSHRVGDAETIFATADILALCRDDFNSLLNQTIRTQTLLYCPGTSNEFLPKLAQLFDALGFPTIQLFGTYTINQLLQFVYFIHINPTTQVPEIHIRKFTSEEDAQFIKEAQEIDAINTTLIREEQLKTLSTLQTSFTQSLQDTQAQLSLLQTCAAYQYARLAQALQQ